MSTRGGEAPEQGESGEDRELPWLAAPLRRNLETQQAHALLIHGPGGVGQFELALALAKGWLCEANDRPLVDRPCGRCASCKLHAARSHPDLLVLVPEALRESLGWDTGAAEGDEAGEGSTKRKPSKEIRVEAVRAAIAFATTTSARGRGKVVVVHPAERMNEVAASAFLKTLEEPAGDARFLLCSAAPDSLLPTIRSRCQQIVLPVPPTRDAEAWLARQGVGQPAVLLAASGGQPQEALELSARGIDGAAWLALPRRVAAGDATALQGWPLPAAVDALQKICHDTASLVCGASPRYFPRERLHGDADIGALLGWSRELARVAEEVDHPWGVDLAIESLVGQGREALKTPRSRGRHGEGLSLNSAR
ncbi:MAG TPA: DNA polymerase III subunit delta' [Caldimonas sp.]|jgi:DNA polymerase-3 subunit delta'|nr:DNA polymerase III subunit delta' [Caldimonas sp.]HEV7577186.1 DNA polymerase III subunit delta' [Caldimonas sp.]